MYIQKFEEPEIQIIKIKQVKSNKPVYKIIFFATFAVFALTVIGYLFWVRELQYLAPTPVPNDYIEVKVMNKVNLEEALGASNGKPFYIHYYNPYCPCSKFNYGYYEYLVRKHGDKFNMYLVIREMDRDVLEDIKSKVFTNITVLVDEKGEIAKQTGVYSTPQAVLLNQDYTLYFRGNYNSSVFCTQKATNYAEMAIDSIMAGKPAPDFGYFATTSYGCKLGKERELFQVMLNVY